MVDLIMNSNHICKKLVKLESDFIFIDGINEDKTCYAFHIVKVEDDLTCIIALDFDRKMDQNLYMKHVHDRYMETITEKLKTMSGCSECSDIWMDKFEVWSDKSHEEIQDDLIRVLDYHSLPEVVKIELEIILDGPDDDPESLN